MTRAAILHPYNPPCCEATRQTIYWRSENGGEMPSCRKPATWSVDGKNFCKVHAGQAALSILMEEK